MTSETITRIQKVQSAQPWMIESEARFMLVSIYSALQHFARTEHFNLEEKFEEMVQMVCDDSRQNLEVYLRDCGELLT